MITTGQGSRLTIGTMGSRGPKLDRAVVLLGVSADSQNEQLVEQLPQLAKSLAPDASSAPLRGLSVTVGGDPDERNTITIQLPESAGKQACAALADSVRHCARNSNCEVWGRGPGFTLHHGFGDIAAHAGIEDAVMAETCVRRSADPS